MATLTGMRQNEAPPVYSPVLLTPDQAVPRRPFTSPTLYQRDIAIMTSMLEDLRTIMAASRKGLREVEPYQRITWRTHGYKRKVIVCRPKRLNRTRDVCVVGFFGDVRTAQGAKVLERANDRIVKEFEHFPGILSYTSFELTGDRWANLVVHEEPEVASAWRENKKHMHAVQELSPIHYRNVRIHNGKVPGGLPGGNWIVIHRTKYWDYRAKRVWHAVRELPSPITA